MVGGPGGGARGSYTTLGGAGSGGCDHPCRYRLPGNVRLEREALALLLDSPRRISQIQEWLTEDHFTVPEHRLVVRALMQASRNGSAASILDALPDDETRRLAAELALTAVTNEAGGGDFLRFEGVRPQRPIPTP